MFYCLLLIFFIFNSVFEFSDSKVIELVDANFNDFTQSDGDLWIVQFHAVKFLPQPPTIPTIIYHRPLSLQQ